MFSGLSLANDEFPAESNGGNVEYDNGTITITSYDDSMYLSLPQDHNLTYTENETWDATYSEIGPSTHNVFFENASLNGTADWYTSPVSADISVNEYVDIQIKDVTNESVELHINNASSAVDFNSEKYNSLTVSRDIDWIRMQEVEIDNKDKGLQWSSDESSTVVVDGFEENRWVTVREESTDRILDVEDTGSNGVVEIQSQPGEYSVYFEEGRGDSFGPMEIEPIYFDSVLQPGETETVSVNVRNTGTSTENVSASTEEDWLELPSTNQQMIDGGETTFMININGSALTEEFQSGTVTFESGGEESQVFIDVESDEVEGQFTSNDWCFLGFCLPQWVILSIIMTTLFIGITGLWVLIEPSNTDNVWH